MRNKHILIFFLLLIIISCENDDKVIDQISEQANKLDRKRIMTSSHFV